MDFQRDCGGRQQCRSLQGNRRIRCQRGCCCQGRTWFGKMLIVHDEFMIYRGFSKQPGVCSLVVATPGASSVAAPARVEHLVGKVLSASTQGGSPGCRVDGVVAGEELRVHVLVPSPMRS